MEQEQYSLTDKKFNNRWWISFIINALLGISLEFLKKTLKKYYDK